MWESGSVTGVCAASRTLSTMIRSVSAQAQVRKNIAGVDARPHGPASDSPLRNPKESYLWRSLQGLHSLG